MRLVVIDDEPDMAQLITDVGAQLGWQSVATTEAKDFEQEVLRGADLVVVDLLMPEVDGVEIIRRLVAQKYLGALVLVSGLDRRLLRVAEDLAQTQGLTTVGVLEKPFRVDELQAFLSGIADGTEGPPVASLERTILSPGEVDQALALGTLVPVFQVQRQLRTGLVWGCEMLARIDDPVRGWIAPGAFIPVIEESGQVREVTFRLVDLAFAAYAEHAPGHWTLSVNLSPRMLGDLAIPDILERSARAVGLKCSRIVVEITESGLIENWSIALDILSRLRIKGFRISIDDYGTGYSSMAQLKAIPATELKIDQLFVRDLTTDHASFEMVRNTIDLAHRLGMSVVAEGIETADQEASLVSLQCDLGQGFLFGRPGLLADVLG